ncbi:hypothetical protein K438DRAFT_1877084, partial [Mycena galopus ATCC 62051]
MPLERHWKGTALEGNLPASSSSSLPDWLTRKNAVREQVKGTIELIQGFEFPEASNHIKAMRDGQFAIATGTYKPQMRVWDLAQLTLKFERHSDTENVDFVMLSDDWTKSIHLQNDRTIEVHTQGGFHYRMCIPRFGQSLTYHFPSCDALFSTAGNKIYRLNLDQGRFMMPLVLQDDTQEILGINTININPAHQLLAFGLDGVGTAQFWDHRSQTSSAGDALLSVMAISSRIDGLSYAVGTSTGHMLLYDIRAAQPFALKDQGSGLPNIAWIEGGSRMAGNGLVLSADRKVIKISDWNSVPSDTAITPAADLNHVHHVPASGLLMTANEGIQMATYYITQLGPASPWTTRSVYEDYKFVERSELKTLGLDHLVGTPMFKLYMHGYFLSLKIYDAARIIANPFAYAEHCEKIMREQMEKMAETRIRAKKDGAAAGIKVNEALAEKILCDEEKRVAVTKVNWGEGEAGDAEGEGEDVPTFAVDETSREYALMNPSAAAHCKNGGDVRRKTAVEEEEESEDKFSSDSLGEGSGSDDEGDSGSGSHNSDAGALNKFDPCAQPGQKNTCVEEAYTRTREQNRCANEGKFVPMRPASTGANSTCLADRNSMFGQRRSRADGKSYGKSRASEGGAVMEVSWVLSASSGEGMDIDDGVDAFGAGMEKGYAGEDLQPEQDRKGRTQRRKSVRSG